MPRRLPALVAVALALMAGWSWRLARAEGGTVATDPAGAHRRDPGRIERPHTPGPAASPDREEIAWEADEEDGEGAAAPLDAASGGLDAGFPDREAALRARPSLGGGRAGNRAPIRAPLRC